MGAGRRLVAFLVAAGLAAAGAWALWSFTTAHRRWSAALGRQESAAARLRSEPAPRERIGGGAGRPGDAWEPYTQGFTALSALSEGEARRPTGPAANALQRVQEGAGRATAAYAFDPAAPPAPDLEGARRAAALLAGIARQRRAAGDPSGALDAVTDAFQVAADVGRIPLDSCRRAAVGALADPALDELRAIVVGPRTPPAALNRVRQVALAFDRSLPSAARAFNGDYTVFGARCRRLLGEATTELPGAWAVARFGFSWKGHFAYLSENWGLQAESASWRESLSWVEVASMPWPGDADFEAKAALTLEVPSWQEAERQVRETRARLRLVQAASAERLGRGPEGPWWPADPFTLGRIHRQRVEDRLVLWSEGADGDQGGRGSWRPTPAESADLVLDLAH